MSAWLRNLFDACSPVQLAGVAAGVLLIAIGCWTLHIWARNPRYQNFNLFYCVANKDGYPDNAKIREWGAYFISSYGFLWLLWGKNMTEWYFIGYMAAWVLAAGYALKKRVEQVQRPPPPIDGTVTTRKTSSESTEVTAAKPHEAKL